jgi:hypothetical protein
MATEEVRRLRHQMAGKVREYEGHLLRLEGQLLVLRARVDRAAGDAAAGLASLLAQTEREVEVAREVGRAALAGLERATDATSACLEQLKSRMAEAGGPNVVEKGRAVVRRATIEAKALRHGVKVGIRVARRVSRRTKATKA